MVRHAVRPPLGYLINCVHPTVLEAALDRVPAAAHRILGLKANTSALRPEHHFVLFTSVLEFTILTRSWKPGRSSVGGCLEPGCGCFWPSNSRSNVHPPAGFDGTCLVYRCSVERPMAMSKSLIAGISMAIPANP